VLVVPRYKRIADILHAGGAYLLLHSDGFTEPYFPGLVDAGIDGVHTIEPAAGMDLARVKRMWGCLTVRFLVDKVGHGMDDIPL
jgi:uroporphyrinogen decarboxylase